MRPRTAIASRRRACEQFSAGAGAVKNTHACAPTPERDTSNAVGTDHALAVFR
jgi:hypothetical protein